MAPTQKVTQDQVNANPNSVLAQVANTVARPGVFTTEWWTVIIAGIASSIIGIFGVSSNTASQVTATIAPAALALIYAFVRSYTKGSLAGVLEAVFPQSGGSALVATGADSGQPGNYKPVGASIPPNVDFLKTSGVIANPLAAWPSGDYVVTADLTGAHWNGQGWDAGKAP